MTLKNIIDVEKNQKEIEFLIDKDVFESAINRVFKKNAPKISIPGFRPGKAPRHVIEKIYGKGFFYEDALNDILPAEYGALLEETKLQVVSRPEFDIASIDENGVVMKVKVFVKPDVDINDYKGITATKDVKKATEEDADKQIDQVRQRNSRLVEITDRPAQMDDTAVIDFEGFVDGKAFEGGKGEKYSLKLGSGQFIPGFEEQIVGKNVGDSFDVNVTFPTEYHAEQLAGKESVFKVTLHELKYTELPALDDEFAKDVSEFDTLAEYKASVLAKIQENNEKNAEGDVSRQISDKLCELLVADIPQAMFDNEVDQMMEDFAHQLSHQGLDIKTYARYTGMTEQQMREQFIPQAEKQVKLRLALEAVAKKENIVPTEERIEEEYKKLGEMYGLEADKVKAAIDKDVLVKDIQVTLAMELVKENAVVKKARAKAAPKAKTEAAEGETEAKPKKRTTKKAATEENTAE